MWESMKDKQSKKKKKRKKENNINTRVGRSKIEMSENDKYKMEREINNGEELKKDVT